MLDQSKHAIWWNSCRRPGRAPGPLLDLRAAGRGGVVAITTIEFGQGFRFLPHQILHERVVAESAVDFERGVLHGARGLALLGREGVGSRDP